MKINVIFFCDNRFLDKKKLSKLNHYDFGKLNLDTL